MKNLFRSAGFASLLIASVLSGIAMQSVNAEVVELITNGDFSNSTPAVNPSTANFSVTSLPGWSTTNPAGSFTLNGQNSGYLPTLINGTAHGAALSLGGTVAFSPFVYSQVVTVPTGVVVESGTFSFYTTVYWDAPTIWSLSGTSGTLLSGTANASYGSWLLVSNTLSSAQAASLQAGENLTVSFRMNSQSNNEGSYIDNVSLSMVTAVPEPSMLAGLGVIGTGLAAVIRRRLRTAKSAS